jgi:hypothetical protein
VASEEDLSRLVSRPLAQHIHSTLQAFQMFDLAIALQPGGGGMSPEDQSFLFPALPLSFQDSLYAFSMDSPRTYDDLEGRVIAYITFSDSVPQGILSRLVLAGMRQGLQEQGLHFRYRHWGYPVLARDHVELLLNGYTMSLTVDHRRSRISCALSCHDHMHLTRPMEAQAGLCIYDLLERVRKAHYPRVRMDLRVIDDDGATHDFVNDVLVSYKVRIRPAPSPVTQPPPAPVMKPVGKTLGSSLRRAGSSLSPERDSGTPLETTGTKFSFTADEWPTAKLDAVTNWGTVFAQTPTSSYRPLPSALPVGTLPSGHAKNPHAPVDPWKSPLVGRLKLLTPGQLPAYLTAPTRRTTRSSIYAALTEDPALALTWRVERYRDGFRLRLYGNSTKSSPGAGGYLTLFSQTSEDDGLLHVVIQEEAQRAALWTADLVDAERALQTISLKRQHNRPMARGEADPRSPVLSYVVVLPAGEEGKSAQVPPLWQFGES